MRLCSKLVIQLRKVLLSNFRNSDAECGLLALKGFIWEVSWIDCFNRLDIACGQSDQAVVEIRDIPSDFNHSSLWLCELGKILVFNCCCEVHQDHVTRLRDCAIDNLKLRMTSPKLFDLLSDICVSDNQVSLFNFKALVLAEFNIGSQWNRSLEDQVSTLWIFDKLEFRVVERNYAFLLKCSLVDVRNGHFNCTLTDCTRINILESHLRRYLAAAEARQLYFGNGLLLSLFARTLEMLFTNGDRQLNLTWVNLFIYNLHRKPSPCPTIVTSNKIKGTGRIKHQYPLSHPNMGEAGDEIRTRDIYLGKVALYH